ncbi:zn-finger domain-containing protein [Gigaspora margarita]|uniref:Zn-finger domain-containing protein n=1 Tax=Gigaspora margarita TaxID=4874 RepID=A0A8H4ADU7_GIGMA|nr:zn-finger domain-containing protein [Gigaspora margarita]
MSDFKYNFCPHTFTKCNTLSKYMNVCALTAGVDEQLFVNNPAQVRKFSNPSKLNQNKNFDINEYKSDSKFSAKKISFKDIKFCKSLKVVKDIQFNSKSNLDSTLASLLHASNTDELASGLDNISFELDNSNINSNMFEFDPTSNLLNDLETTIDKDQEFSNEILNNSTYFEHIRSSSSDEKFDQKYEEFSNEAYANLMVLVTKYKLSNAAGNAIISFFNKHPKHSISPLSKNIRQGKEFMNNIKSNLSYKKTKVLDLDDTEYFLYYMPLISCIENILKIPDIAQNLEFEYKELYKTTEDVNRDDLANTTHSKHDLVLRNHENMRNCLDKNEDKS